MIKWQTSIIVKVFQPHRWFNKLAGSVMGQYNRVYGTVISLAHLDIHWVIHSAKTLDQISKEWEGSALWFYQSCKVRHFHVYSFEHWNRADHHWLRCWYKGCILYVCASNITENKTKWCTKDHILTAGHGFALSREPQNFSRVQTGAVRRYVSEIERERWKCGGKPWVRFYSVIYHRMKETNTEATLKTVYDQHIVRWGQV